MNEIEIYSSTQCPFCVRAKQLLHAKGQSISRELRVDVDPQLRAQMTERTGRRSVPQVFINGRHIGGFDDLAALERAGELDRLLRAGDPS